MIVTQTRDTITIKLLYQYFLPIHYVHKKKYYFKIALQIISKLYEKILSKLLYSVRTNRTFPLHASTDNEGMPMTSWLLDSIIDLIQKFFHTIEIEDLLQGWF